MTAWHEIVVEGSEKVLRAFAQGFAAGHPGRDATLLGTDVDLAPTSFHERLRGLFAAGSHHLLLAPATTAVELAAAIRSHGDSVGLRVVGISEVVRARLAVAIETFSVGVARRFRDELLASLPGGVAVEDLEQAEESDSSAKGTELYSPTHDYTFKASGTFAGPLPGVLEMQRRAKALEHVTVEALAVETRELSAS
ncbi:MAG: hypothetical protein HY825_10260 [Acidobacteria bacterium]|nr:hypothetical protein [Acidobacteriota bacterium]